MRKDLSEADRRLNVESRLLAILSTYGGQVIVSSPPMDQMIREMADEAEALAREGFLPEAGTRAAPDDERYPVGWWAGFDQDTADTCETNIDLAAVVLNRMGGDPGRAAVELVNILAEILTTDEAVSVLAALAVRAAIARTVTGA